MGTAKLGMGLACVIVYLPLPIIFPLPEAETVKQFSPGVVRAEAGTV